MLTIHNMDNSGECRQDEFAFAGTAPAALTSCLKMIRNEDTQHWRLQEGGGFQQPNTLSGRYGSG